MMLGAVELSVHTHLHFPGKDNHHVYTHDHHVYTHDHHVYTHKHTRTQTHTHIFMYTHTRTYIERTRVLKTYIQLLPINDSGEDPAPCSASSSFALHPCRAHTHTYTYTHTDFAHQRLRRGSIAIQCIVVLCIASLVRASRSSMPVLQRQDGCGHERAYGLGTEFG